jgi:4-hydroxy-tetrahydrodipicolinate reductase
MTTVAVNGATGRMGRTVIETAADRDDVDAVVGFDVADADEVQGVPVVDAENVAEGLAEYDPDVVVDFTIPEATRSLADACVEAGVGIVVGTTGFSDEGFDRLQAASESVPLLKATNFARGVHALLRRGAGGRPGVRSGTDGDPSQREDRRALGDRQDHPRHRPGPPRR